MRFKEQQSLISFKCKTRFSALEMSARNQEKYLFLSEYTQDIRQDDQSYFEEAYSM